MKKRSARISSNQIICSSRLVRQLSSGCAKPWCLPGVGKGCCLFVEYLSCCLLAATAHRESSGVGSHLMNKVDRLG